MLVAHVDLRACVEQKCRDLDAATLGGVMQRRIFALVLLIAIHTPPVLSLALDAALLTLALGRRLSRFALGLPARLLASRALAACCAFVRPMEARFPETTYVGVHTRELSASAANRAPLMQP